jgi:hypothetical protein
MGGNENIKIILKWILNDIGCLSMDYVGLKVAGCCAYGNELF